MLNHVCRLMALAAVAATTSVVAGAQTISTVIPFPAATNGIAVDPVRNSVYVVAPDVTDTIFNLAVIDGASNTVTANIPLPAGSLFPAVDYLSNRIYVAGCNNLVTPIACTVTVIDGNKDSVVTTIPVTTTGGDGLTGIVVNPLDGLVYVANANDNVIDIINGRKATVVDTISLGSNSPSAIALNPILNLLYVPYGTNQTAVVNASNKQISKTITFGSTTVGAAVNVLTGNVFVTDQEFDGPSLTGVFGPLGHAVANVSVGAFPVGVDVDSFTNLAFVASPSSNQLAVIDGSSNTLKATVSNIQAQFVAVNPTTQLVYTSGENGVTVLTEK
ncbi:YncE family protein [Granulicella mallensis]|jgi:DNA-binding beta-propeller fold protein YncE|uniref:DNA-binding beta-propeller fold protein YncE n=1 Tax=Granulicella mallensis TaxID=940614 RepID=A0A7W7ZU15_9BACT|nr:YncE family protein [Granulicella mallensis]MBB5066081.1 DNA-binding beta-propeller fold protein YncE [Granulicella mallensis]